MSSNLLRLIRLAASYKGWMMLAALLGFLTIGSNIGLLMTSAYIIAQAALHPSIAELQVAIVGVRFFGLSRGIFRYLERYISHELTFRLLARFRAWFYRAIEPLAPARFVYFKSGDLLNRAVADIENLKHIYIRVLAPPFIAILVFFLMWLLFGVIDPTLPLLLALAFFLAGIVVPMLILKFSRNMGRGLVRLHAELQTRLVENIQGMAELLIYDSHQRHLQAIAALNLRYNRLQRQMSLLGSWHEAAIGLIMNLTILAVLLIDIPKVANNTLNGVYLSVLVLGLMAAFEALLPLPIAAQYLDQSLESARRLFEMIDTRPTVHEPERSQAPGPDVSLKLENLSFTYPGQNSPALKDISLLVPVGAKMAIVGPSGAGKTTLLNLLARFWDYDSGNIYLGAQELRALSPERVRALLSVVSQNTFLFNATLRDNLLLARPQATEIELNAAVSAAQLDRLIQSLPEKYDTWIGEQGLKLSGGERQRLAIARAVLKNTPLVILDEATAGLDLVTEQAVLKNCLALFQSKTVLIISHRLPGLEQMDQIFVLVNGTIVEYGDWAELVAGKGRFRQMWDLANQSVAFNAVS